MNAMLLSGFLGAVTCAVASSQTKPYRADHPLDQVRGARVSLANFAVRPMVLVPGTRSRPDEKLWVVNQHQDLIEVFDAPALGQSTFESPSISTHVPWDPSAVAYWGGRRGGQDEVLVAARGTYGLTHLDATTGKIVGFTTLLPSDFNRAVGSRGHGRMAEPSDILVDGNTGMAFVSCMGADAVIQVDLATRTVVRRFHVDEGMPINDPAFRIKSPLFLSFDQRTASKPRRVLVTPLHSGNGTTLGTSGLDFQGPIDVPGNLWPDTTPLPLPDEDVFSIDPWVSDASRGSVAVALRDQGTILFAHETNAVTGDLWLLNTDHHNGGVLNNSEPKVRGRFATNQISQTVDFGGTAQTVKRIILDKDGINGAITADRVVGQPFQLTFGLGGGAFVCGLLTDNVLQLDRNGTFGREWDLPDGSIPRGLMSYLVAGREHVLVYCWGTNKVLQYNTAPQAPVLVRTLELTPDTAPENVQDGRRLFYDGSRSGPGNLSCATCHVEGGTDMLSWDLSPAPIQAKGAMVTQTLVGIEKLGPFHWRGERDFLDFNPAFDGLLANHDPGNGQQLSEADFADFEAFIFSLRNPANPNQNRDRVVDASIHDRNGPAGIVGDARVGQTFFHDEDAIGGHHCTDCHSPPTGSSAEIFPIFGGSPRPEVARLVAPALHELWRKDQPTVDLLNSPDGSPDDRPFLGFGYSHGGLRSSLFDFLSFIPDDPATMSDLQRRVDVADFLKQWDQGLAPSAHFAFWVDKESVRSGTANDHAFKYLEAGAKPAALDCDVVVIGQTKTGGVLKSRRWWFDRDVSGGPAYRCEDTSIPNRSYAQFEAGVQSGESHLFLGYPVGMGERMGLDRDMDGITDFDELAAGSDPLDEDDPGTSLGGAPTLVASPTVLWVNTRHARLDFQSTQPATWAVQYREVGQANWELVIGPDVLSRHHTPLLRGLRFKTEKGAQANEPTVIMDETFQYEYQVTVINRNGARSTSSIQTFEPANFTTNDDFLVATGAGAVSELTQHEGFKITESTLSRVGSSTTYALDLDMEFVRGASTNPLPQNIIVVGRVLIERCTNLGTPSDPDYDCEELEPVPVGNLVAGTNAIVRKNVDIGDGPNEVLLKAGTDYVISRMPASNGSISAQFTLAGVPLDIDDRVIFAIDGMFQVNPATWPPSGGTTMSTIDIGLTNTRNRGRFDFPSSGEALAAPFFRLP